MNYLYSKVAKCFVNLKANWKVEVLRLLCRELNITRAELGEKTQLSSTLKLKAKGQSHEAYQNYGIYSYLSLFSLFILLTIS